MAGTQRATDHVLHAIKTLGADRHPWRDSRLFMRRAAQAFSVNNYRLLSIAGQCSHIVGLWLMSRLRLSSSCFHQLSSGLYISDLARLSLAQLAPYDHLTSDRWKANNGALPYGEANLWTKFRRGWQQLWLALSWRLQMLRIRIYRLSAIKHVDRLSTFIYSTWVKWTSNGSIQYQRRGGYSNMKISRRLVA